MAIVFQRSLPYVYLAKNVLESAGLPYQTFDALPLASEPFAAAFDLVLALLASELSRTGLVDLLGSPHFRFEVDGLPIAASEVAALDRALAETRTDDLMAPLQALASGATHLGPATSNLEPADPARRAARAATTSLSELAEIGRGTSASTQFQALLAFLCAHERTPRSDDPDLERALRARTAITSAIEALRQAHQRWADEPVSGIELASRIRRWIEGQTFAPRTGGSGIALVDAATAPFGDFDHVWIVGLVEEEWPDRPARNIFYPASLLTKLGWPKESERMPAAQAAFRDLLTLAARQVTLSTFALEEDRLVNPSSLLEEVSSQQLVREPARPLETSRIFADEALEDPVTLEALSPGEREWARLRLARTPSNDRAYHGWTSPHLQPAYAVAALEQYLDCPFKYYAAHVLQLEEEQELDPGLTPRERGIFVHELLGDFFTRWQRDKQGAITYANLPAARTLFEQVADDHLARLSLGDRFIERTKLFGSPAITGLIERVFGLELERDRSVSERLLEYPLEGAYAFDDGSRQQLVNLRGVVDRVDLLEGGSFRLVDYKIGHARPRGRAIQLPVYGLCCERQLAGYRGGNWRLGEAGYLAFGDKKTFVPMISLASDPSAALQEGQRRLLDAVEGIEHGEFPPRPADQILCTFCAYSSVCRKDIIDAE